MSTIKVDTYQTRGGASEIAIDKLKGVSSAGSMTVVGEGGSTTTNLQQGLAKAWVDSAARPRAKNGQYPPTPSEYVAMPTPKAFVSGQRATMV